MGSGRLRNQDPVTTPQGGNPGVVDYAQLAEAAPAVGNCASSVLAYSRLKSDRTLYFIHSVLSHKKPMRDPKPPIQINIFHFCDHTQDDVYESMRKIVIGNKLRWLAVSPPRKTRRGEVTYGKENMSHPSARSKARHSASFHDSTRAQRSTEPYNA